MSLNENGTATTGVSIKGKLFCLGVLDVTKSKRIVVKVGTSSLVNQNGTVNLQTIDRMAFTLSALNNQDYSVMLVTSGAIGVGLDKLGLKSRPHEIAKQQALAAIGQLQLMTDYMDRFSDYGTQVAQLLLTQDVFDYPVNKKNVMNTIGELFASNVIPIVNENDTVSDTEMDHLTTFGDNDQLSALVATQINADLLIVLSDIDGLFDKNPNRYPDAHLISHVETLTPAIMKAATGSDSRFGTGGMVTKLKAAQLMMKAGKQMILCNGADPRIILKVFNGEKVGTLFGQATEGD